MAWGPVIVVAVLRTGFETAAAGHAAGQGVAFLGRFVGDMRAGAEVVCAVELDPGAHLFEMIEHF